MPLAFPPPTAARDDLDGLLVLGSQPTVENLVADEVAQKRSSALSATC